MGKHAPRPSLSGLVIDVIGLESRAKSLGPQSKPKMALRAVMETVHLACNSIQMATIMPKDKSVKVYLVDSWIDGGRNVSGKWESTSISLSTRILVFPEPPNHIKWKKDSTRTRATNPQGRVFLVPPIYLDCFDPHFSSLLPSTTLSLVFAIVAWGFYSDYLLN